MNSPSSSTSSFDETEEKGKSIGADGDDNGSSKNMKASLSSHISTDSSSSDDFAFEDNESKYGSGGLLESKKAQAVTNKSYDEALDLSNASTMQSEVPSPLRGSAVKNENSRTETKTIKNKEYDEAHELSSEDTLADSVDTEKDSRVVGADLGSSKSSSSTTSTLNGGDSPPAEARTSSIERSGYNESEDKDLGETKVSSSINFSSSSSSSSSSSRKRKKKNILSNNEDINTKKDNRSNSISGNSTGKDIDILSSNSSSNSSSSSENYTSSDDGGKTIKKDSNKNVRSKFKRYNARDYDDLNVSKEVKDLFQYIERYKPTKVKLETKFRCFVPDFIPSIGEIDTFVKVKEPEETKTDVGRKVLDEPSSTQTDGALLELQLRSASKKNNLHEMSIRSISNAEKNTKQITKWINNIEELHRKKPLPTVQYSNEMPDIESLMQVWPEKFEECLEKHKLPSARMDIDTETYAKICCALLDIPVYNDAVEALHVFFTLYLEFRNNAHFGIRQQQGTRTGGQDDDDFRLLK
eukprot:g5710.t1